MQDNENGKIKNEVTLCDKHLVHSKPKEFDTRRIQTKKNSVVKEVTPSTLGNFLTTGHSIHYAVCDFDVVPTGKFDKYGNPEYVEGKKTTFQDKSALYANVFGIDLDHGNFSIDDVINKSIVKPAVIHETHSSKESDKRYRVYYFANENVDTAQLRLMNTILNLPFWDGLPQHETELVDKSCINESRVFYPGPTLKYVEDNYFNPTELLGNQELVNRANKVLEHVKKCNSNRIKRANIMKKAFEKQLITKEIYNEFIFKHKEDKHNPVSYRENVVIAAKMEKELECLAQEEKEARRRKKTSVNANTGEVVVNTKSELSDLTPTEFLETVLFNLKTLNKEGIEQLDFTDAEEFIHNLDLDDIIGVSVGDRFLCPFHDDNNPSGSLFVGRGGDIMFGCFTDCTDALNTMGFLRKLLTQHGLSDNYYETIRVILEAMDIELGNKYQDQIYLQLVHFQNYLKKKEPLRDKKRVIKNKKDVDNLSLWLEKHNLFVFFFGLFQLAFYFAPKKAVKLNGDGAVISVSRRRLYNYLNNEGVKGVKSEGNCHNKVNVLCYLGFIRKVEFNELNDNTKIELLASKKLIENEINQKRKMKNKGKNVGLISVAHTSYYEFNPINKKTWEEAIRRMELFVKHGCKVSTFNSKQLAYLLSVAEAKEVYSQLNDKQLELNQTEKKFIFEVEKAILRFNGRSYFTKEELISKIDPSYHYFKKKEKVSLGEKLFPGFLANNGFEIVTLNQQVREKYDIPMKYKSKTKIIIKTISN